MREWALELKCEGDRERERERDRERDRERECERVRERIWQWDKVRWSWREGEHERDVVGEVLVGVDNSEGERDSLGDNDFLFVDIMDITDVIGFLGNSSAKKGEE